MSDNNKLIEWARECGAAVREGDLCGEYVCIMVFSPEKLQAYTALAMKERDEQEERLYKRYEAEAEYQTNEVAELKAAVDRLCLYCELLREALSDIRFELSEWNIPPEDFRAIKQLERMAFNIPSDELVTQSLTELSRERVCTWSPLGSALLWCIMRIKMSNVKPTSAKSAKAIATIEKMLADLCGTDDEREALEQALHLLKMYGIWEAEE